MYERRFSTAALDRPDDEGNPARPDGRFAGTSHLILKAAWLEEPHPLGGFGWAVALQFGRARSRPMLR